MGSKITILPKYLVSKGDVRCEARVAVLAPITLIIRRHPSTFSIGINAAASLH